LEHGDDLAVGKAGLLHGTSSGKGTRKFHFWRLLIGGGITLEEVAVNSQSLITVGFSRHTYKNNSQNPISFVKT
ncbi:hypothetical protein, partial [Xanthomonas euvesicatoria]|uniref:hypothetical protein n=1 Tax=Xanthomonas euvesicatoria TaxID=456327 RepID=UPI001C2F8AFC